MRNVDRKDTLNNSKIVKILIILLFMALSVSGKEYYENVVPGVPVAPGKRLGGLWKKTEPECEHDMSQLDIMKAEARKSAANWRLVAFWASLVAFGSLIVWYLTKIGQVAGVAVISIAYSIFSTFMAALVTLTWLLVLVAVALALVALGIYLHKKSFFEWIKNKKRKKASDPNHFVGEGLQ